MTSLVKRGVPFALAMAAGLLTSGMLYGVLSNQPKASAATTEPMVITADAVDDAKSLTMADLTVVEVARRPSGAFAAPGELVGRLPLVPVPAGQPLLSSHLAPLGSQPGLWHSLPLGKRAVTVAVNEVVGVGGFIKPGLDVDIIGVAQDGTTWVSNTVAQDVPVLAIAQDDKKDKDDHTARIATSATLLVDPKQAEAISLASEKGRIRLVLRAQGDHELSVLAAPAIVRIATHTSPTVAAPHHEEPPGPGIEIIRGMNSEVVRP